MIISDDSSIITKLGFPYNMPLWIKHFFQSFHPKHSNEATKKQTVIVCEGIREKETLKENNKRNRNKKREDNVSAYISELRHYVHY